MPIFTIRTTSGREDVVIDMLESNVKSESLEIKSIFHPAEIKGYIFVEGMLGAVQKGMHGLMHAKGLIEKPVNLEEIRHFLEQKKAMIRVSEGDTVEIIGGPFRGEKGEIKRVDKVKDEVTIELLEASIPIPVTIATEFIKITKKVKSEEIEEAKPKPEEPPKEPEAAETEAGPKPESAAAEEESAFDLKALKEREEARTGEKPETEKEKKPETKAEDKKEEEPKKLSLSEPKKQMGGKPEEAEPARETEKEKDGLEQLDEAAQPAEEEGLKGGILEELEREEKEKKKKKIRDLESLEEGE